LRRRDAGYWQFIAGGGEDNETPEQAARREASEEAGIQDDARFIRLDSTSTVPKEDFAAAALWPSDLYAIPEYCFAVDMRNRNIAMSSEHSECRWAPYEEARRLLRWDSNRNALWEVNARLNKESNAS
jgi:dATP pyrophosphohydrolase